MDRYLPTHLITARELAGLTVIQMAERLGCGQPFLSDVERGLRKCPARVRKAYEALVEEGRERELFYARSIAGIETE